MAPFARISPRRRPLPLPVPTNRPPRLNHSTVICHVTIHSLIRLSNKQSFAFSAVHRHLLKPVHLRPSASICVHFVPESLVRPASKNRVDTLRGLGYTSEALTNP